MACSRHTSTYFFCSSRIVSKYASCSWKCSLSLLSPLITYFLIFRLHESLDFLGDFVDFARHFLHFSQFKKSFGWRFKRFDELKLSTFLFEKKFTGGNYLILIMIMIFLSLMEFSMIEIKWNTYPMTGSQNAIKLAMSFVSFESVDEFLDFGADLKNGDNSDKDFIINWWKNSILIFLSVDNFSKFSPRIFGTGCSSNPIKTFEKW